MKKLAYASILAVGLMGLNCAFDNDEEGNINQKADNVRDLTPVEAQFVVAPDAEKVSFLKSESELSKVKAGDIIVSDQNAGSPSGYLKKVTSIEKNGDQTTIKTTPASITEAVVHGSAYAEGTLTPAGDNKLLQGATYNPTTGKIETIQPAPGITVFGTTQPQNAIPECKSKKWYVEFNNVNIQNAGNINGCVGLDLKFVLSMKIKWFELKNAEFSVSPSVVTKLAVNVNNATFEINRAQVTLTTFHLQPITFMIGFVPVVIVPRIQLVLGVDGKVSASLTTSVQYAASAKAGIVYENKKWTKIKEKQSTYNIVPPVFSGNLNAMVYIGPVATFLLYGVAGPGANLFVYSRFNVVWNQALNNVQKWEIWLGAEAGAHFTVEAFGRTLFRIEDPSLIGYEGLIASSDYAGIAPAGTGQVTGTIVDKINGNYKDSGGAWKNMSGDLVTVGKQVGALASK